MLTPKSIEPQFLVEASNIFLTELAQKPEAIQPTTRPLAPSLYDYFLALPAIIVAATPLILGMMNKNKDKGKTTQ